MAVYCFLLLLPFPLPSPLFGSAAVSGEGKKSRARARAQLTSVHVIFALPLLDASNGQCSLLLMCSLVAVAF